MGSYLRQRRLTGILAGLALLLSLAPQPVLGATATSDVSLTLAVDRGTVRVGQDVQIVATMTNHGPDDAAFVDTEFAWPDRLVLVSITCDRGISPDTPGCEYSSLRAGETVVSVLTVTPQAGGPGSARKLTVTARASFEVDCAFDPNCTFDPNRRNNAASVTTRLIGRTKGG